MSDFFSLFSSSLSTVCFCSGGLFLQWVRAADVAAAADGGPGLHWNTVLLRGGEDAELLSGYAGVLETRPLHLFVRLNFFVVSFCKWDWFGSSEKTKQNKKLEYSETEFCDRCSTVS